MKSNLPRDRLVLLASGLLVLLGPVVILAATLAVLVLLGDLTLSEITLLDFLELYIIDLVLLVGFAYGIYRLTLWLAAHQIPATIDALEGDETDSSHDEESNTTEKL